jgi:hypothetical protein
MSRDFIDTVVVPFSSAEHFDADLETVKQEYSENDARILSANCQGALQEFFL